MFDVEIGWIALLGAAVLWPIRRLMVRARMLQLTKAWTDWAVVQTEVTLEGFMAFGILALSGVASDRVITRWPVGFDPVVSMGTHILAAASLAAAIEAVRHPGFVTRLGMIFFGVAWSVAGALAYLTAYKPAPASDPTRALPMVMLLGLGAYTFSWWQRRRSPAERETQTQ